MFVLLFLSRDSHGKVGALGMTYLAIGSLPRVSFLFSDCSLCRESKTPCFSSSSHFPNLLSICLKWLLSSSPLTSSLSWIMPRVLLVQYPIISSHHKGMPREKGLPTRTLSYQLSPELEVISVYSVTLSGLLFHALVPWICTNSAIHSSFCNRAYASASATGVDCGAGDVVPVPTGSIRGWESSGFKSLEGRPKILSPRPCSAHPRPHLWHMALCRPHYQAPAQVRVGRAGIRVLASCSTWAKAYTGPGEQEPFSLSCQQKQVP